jgi:DNA-binding SARP family transcriptional activator
MPNSDSRQDGPFVLRLLGTPRIEASGGVLTGEVSQRHRLALLALLALAPERLLARDRIQGMLWPETDQGSARRRLNSTVFVIRRALGVEVLRSEADGVGLNAWALRVDVLEFQSALEAGDAATAAALYKGPFLEGLALPNAAEFDQWVDLQRDRLARLYHTALEQLAEADTAKGQLTKAVEWWRQRLACTPAEGRVVLRLMHALADAGDRASALRAAAVHASLLKNEFGAAPDPQVESFAEELRLAPKALPVEIGLATSRPAGVAPSMATSGEWPDPTARRNLDAARISKAQARRRISLIGGLSAAAIGVFIFAAIAFARRPEPARPWTIVADVTGTADSSYRAAVREIVRHELDGSTVIRTVPTNDIVVAMNRAGMPVTAGLTMELARELAVRYQMRSVVDVRLDRIGATYSILLRAIEAETGNILKVADATANGENAVLEAIKRAARDLRRKLGEQRRLLGSGRHQGPPATPSLEAYRKWVAGMETFQKRADRRGRIVLMREAIALDSAFATAWYVLGLDYFGVGVPDSAIYALDRARHHSERMNDFERMRVEERYAAFTGDYHKSLEISDRMVMRFPHDDRPRLERAIRLRYLGRHDEALEDYQEARRLSPFGLTPAYVMNEAFTLLALGRHDEAWEVMQRLGTATTGGRIGQAITAIVTERWTAAERLADQFQSAMAGQPTLWRAGPLAARGQARQAMDSLSRLDASPVWVGFASPSRAQVAPRTRILLSFASGLPLAPLGPAVTADTSLSARITRGYWSALAGEPTEARRTAMLLHSLPAEVRREYGVWAEMIDALIAASNRDWTRMLSLAPRAHELHGDVWHEFQNDAVLPAVLQFFVAHAFEQTARADSAVFYYNLVVAPRQGITHGNEFPRAAGFSFAHQRLVVLYSRLGRLDEAKRHWKIFSETFTKPDPELVALVVEAREALRSAERRAN